MRYHIDPAPVDRELKRYKTKPSEGTLSDLYETIDPVIVTVTERISRTYRRNYPADFQDIQQAVRLDIFKALQRADPPEYNVRLFVKDGDQLIRIMVSLILFSFRNHYRLWKENNPVKPPYNCIFVTEWLPDKNVPIDLSIDLEEVALVVEERTKIDERPYLKVFLNDLPDKICSTALQHNRFNGHSPEILSFCFKAILEGRSPSRSLMQRLWPSEDVMFWSKYAEVLLRIATLKLADQVPL